jgi:hypothetical protein
LTDIQTAFLQHYESDHGRNRVSNYPPYFLGSIITSPPIDGKKPLIDGQQRLTSAFLILAYLERLRSDSGVTDAFDLGSLLGSVAFGVQDYSIEFSEGRRQIFARYLDKTKTAVDAMSDAEEVTGLDDGDRRVLEALRSIDAVLDSDVRRALPFFIDYVVERVLLIDIAVESESEAHRVFVTMNDRGLRLGPIDLLKGRILSNATGQDSSACLEAWTQTINALRAIDPEEDSLFFRTLFRAKWATTIRGKKKAPPQDFEIIGDEYHRWFEEHAKAELGLRTGDDYARFARIEIPRYAEIYRFIKSAEESLTDGFEWIYYNAVRRYSFQSMVLLSPIKATDTDGNWREKVALVSQLVDVMLTSRIIDGKENNYDNLKELSFQLTKEVRDKSYGDLLSFVRAEWPKYESSIPRIAQLRYAKAERSDLLYVLARIAAHLEHEFTLTNGVTFPSYWQRDKNMKTFDIEHLFREGFDPTALPAAHGFADGKDYAESRDLLGALVLLPRGRNRSLKDKPYRDKLPAYATESVLAQTLCEDFYKSNPAVSRYLASVPDVPLSAIADFSKGDIAKRADAYIALAKRIWRCP